MSSQPELSAEKIASRLNQLCKKIEQQERQVHQLQKQARQLQKQLQRVQGQATPSEKIVDLAPSLPLRVRVGQWWLYQNQYHGAVVHSFAIAAFAALFGEAVFSLPLWVGFIGGFFGTAMLFALMYSLADIPEEA